jgi:hypothetical protein
MVVVGRAKGTSVVVAEGVVVLAVEEKAGEA